MQPILKHIDSFTVKGLSTRTQNSDEFNEKTAQLPALWQQFLSTDLARNAAIFGVYSNYESDENGLYNMTIGIASDKPQDVFHTVSIQTGDYLVFQGTGPMPATVIAVWQRVWDYFKKDNPYQRNFISDFEAYTGEDAVAIHIGVK